MFASEKSLQGNTSVQVFTTDFGFTYVKPMASKGDAHVALSNLFEDVGVPIHIHADNAKELNLGKMEEDMRESRWYKDADYGTRESVAESSRNRD